MSALPICEKLLAYAAALVTEPEAPTDLRVGKAMSANVMTEAADIIRALYEALLLVSRNSGKLYNDEWQFVESTLAKARGEQ